MRSNHFITDIFFTFWFGWFAIAGVVITVVSNWVFSLHYSREDLLMAGATIGIITGGVAALVFFLIGRARKLNGFDEPWPK